MSPSSQAAGVQLMPCVLYLLEAHVAVTDRSKWPDGLVGGILPLFVFAESAESAIETAMNEISAQALRLVGWEASPTEIALRDFDEYVSRNWPACTDLFPKASALDLIWSRHRVVLGPMFGYEA